MADQALAAHRRYLEAMRAACAANPPVHSHQLAALDREISLAADAADGDGYRAASGDLFELARAAWLDRAANRARVAVAVGDSRGAEAAAVEHRHALGASGHEDWTDCVLAGGALAEPLAARSSEASSSFATLVRCTFQLRTSGSEVGQAEWRDQALAGAQVLHAADPAFSWSPLSRRYALRTPWTGLGLEALRGWVRELEPGDDRVPRDPKPEDPLEAIEAAEARWRSELVRRAGAAPTRPEPTVAEVMAPYRELAASSTGGDRGANATREAARALVAAAAAAPTAHDALARIVSDGLQVALAVAPLRGRAEDALERQSTWPDPLVEHHWRALLANLARTRTETEVELVSVHADACLAVEADWNAALLGGLLAPVRAACTYGAEATGDTAAELRQAAAATYALVGLGPRRILGVPRVAAFVDAILVPLARGDSGALGAFRGEGGFDVLREARVWTETARGRGEEVPRDAAEMTAALATLFDRCSVAEPAPRPQPVTLWGDVIDPDDLVPALGRSSRPGIPGIEAVARDRSGL